ncbi:MAG: ParB/RepB/Spo0J family partition protein [Lachnospiraceae bacterium]|jgi:ParB family chromosome partitioning protein
MAKARTGLGKGIDLLIPSGFGEEIEAATGDALTLKLSQIEPNRNQPRKQFDKESLEELTESIKRHGIIEPIVVCKRDDYYEIVAGERRWRAAKKAELKEIPVIIKEYTETEIAEISLIENIQREDLNPIEEARAYRQLIDDYRLTQEELAQRVSKSRVTITNTLRLLRLHSDVQEMLLKGEISAGHARALLGLESGEAQQEVAQRILEELLSVRQTEDIVRNYNKPRPAKKETIENSADYKALETKMTEALGTKVVIKQQETGRGKVEISYYSEDQLDQIYKTINLGSL